MAILTIRNLDETTKARLRVRAAHNGRSMEAEAREILRRTVGIVPESELPSGLGTRIHSLFAEIGGVDLPIPTDIVERDPPDFSDWPEPEERA